MGTDRMGNRPGPSTAVAAMTVTVLIALGLFAAVARRTFRVVAEGRLLPYTAGRIYEVEVLGVRLFVEPEVVPTSDVIVAAVLLAVASMAALTWIVLQRQRVGDREVRRFFGVVLVGCAFLSADELFGIHESIGHNLPGLTALPGIARPDDAVVIAYVCAAAVFVVVSRRFLMSSRHALQSWSAALVVFGVAAVADALSVVGEEMLELIGALLLLFGFAVLAADTLRSTMTPAGAASPPPSDRDRAGAV